MDEVYGFASFFIGGWGTSFTAYVVLQAIALVTLKGWLRILAMLPMPFMGALALTTFSAYRQDSNMWPLLMIFLSPVALLYVAGLELFGVGVQAHPSGARLSFITFGVLVAACLPYVLIFAVAA